MWWGLNVPASACLSAGIFLRSAPLASAAQHFGVARAGHECVKHQPAGHAEHVGGDAGELDPGVLERLLPPIGIAGALADQRLAIPGQIAQLAEPTVR